jgi:hypothetical protein
MRSAFDGNWNVWYVLACTLTRISLKAVGYDI